MNISGKVVLVTGGAGGLGRAIAARFCAEGSRVVLVDLDEEEGRRCVEELRAAGGEAEFFTADVARAEEVEAMVEFAERRYGGLDVLVSNAGGYEGPVFPDAEIEHWKRTLDVNLYGVMLGAHFAIRSMTGRGGGAIVNVASSAGLGLDPYGGPEYAAAKAGAIRLTGALAMLAERGIRVSCIAPHTIATPAVRARIAELKAEGRPLPWDLDGTLLEAGEVADAVVELARGDDVAGRVVALRGGEPRRVLWARGRNYTGPHGRHGLTGAPDRDERACDLRAGRRRRGAARRGRGGRARDARARGDGDRGDRGA